jgi:hypothetical protein
MYAPNHKLAFCRGHYVMAYMHASVSVSISFPSINTLVAEGFLIIYVASAGISAIFTNFRLKN